MSEFKNPGGENSGSLSKDDLYKKTSDSLSDEVGMEEFPYKTADEMNKAITAFEAIENNEHASLEDKDIAHDKLVGLRSRLEALQSEEIK